MLQYIQITFWHIFKCFHICRPLCVLSLDLTGGQSLHIAPFPCLMTHLYTHLRPGHMGGLGRVAVDGEHISGRKSAVSLDVERLKLEAGSRQCYLCASVPACACVRGLVPTPECVYLTCLGIQNPLSFSPARLALAVTARWDTARRLLFHTALY